eukprot:jgi/Mesvir1/22855/Mv20107-RA.2
MIPPTLTAPRRQVLGSEHPVDKKDLLSLHKCLYIFKCLGKLSDFQESYVTNRRLQLSSVLQPGGPPFLDSYKPFLAQIVGFFLVEDKTLRTADGLVTSSHVDALWEAAAEKIQSLVWTQFDRQPLARGATPDASHNIAPLAALNEFMQLVLATLGRYGLKMSNLEATMVRCMRRYQVLLTANAEEKVRNAIKADRYQQVLIGSPVMHQNLVVAYQLYPRDHTGPPPVSTIPYYAAFSHGVPELISVLKNYVEDCFSALETSHGSTQPFPSLGVANSDASTRSNTNTVGGAANSGSTNASNANTPGGGATPGGSVAGGSVHEDDVAASADDALLSPRSGGISLHSALKECLDAILRGAVAETFRGILFSASLAVPQAMQVVSNIGSLLQACDALARHVALCCGVPVEAPVPKSDGSEGTVRSISLKSPSANVNGWELRSWEVLAREVRLNDELAREMRSWEVLARLQEEGKAVVLRLTEEKLRSFLVLPEEWTPEVAPSGPSEYLSDLVAYLRTVLETSLRLLPAVTVHTLHVMALQLVADALLEKLSSDAVKGFNMRAIEGLDLDVTVLEAFADDRTAVAINARTTPVPVGGSGTNATGVSNELAKLFKESLPLKECMSGPRHLINFFKRACVEEDETLLAGNVKDKFFPHMKKAQVATILDKYRKAPSAGLFGMKNKKRDPRKSTVYACARLLRASP